MPRRSSTISVVAELERMGWGFEWSGDNTVKCACPFHDDQSPSCSIDTKTTRFQCYTAGCNANGDIISFIARVFETSRSVIHEDLSKRYDMGDTDKTIDGSVVEQAHLKIWDAKPLVAELAARAVGPELIRKFRLGEQRGRITIPVKNDAGMFVNLRRYLPGAPGKDKMRNIKGCGKIRLFPIDQLEYPKLVIFGGEVKAIAASAVLNPLGIGCISTTGGEGNWDHQFTSRVAGKKVWICFDIDAEGVKAATQVAVLIHRFCSWLGIVELPLDANEYPHGDVNDYLMLEDADLASVVTSTSRYTIDVEDEVDPDADPEDVELSVACLAGNVAKPLRIKTIVSALGDAPYSVPSKTIVACDRSQKYCGTCAVYPHDEDFVFEIKSASPGILKMVGTSDDQQSYALMSELGIPRDCRVCSFKPKEFYNVEDVRISPKLNATSRAVEREMLPAVVIGDGIELNETYEMVGRMFPHPKTQQATLVLDQFEVVQDSLSEYDPGDTTELEIFQEGFEAIHKDIEANVTHVYKRPDLHLIADLSYHSPLWIRFDGQVIKGWVETLIAGDSAQGKSMCIKSLAAHYDAGAVVDCKNLTVAGLIGGMQQIAGRWFATWGVMPNNDKRLVILEELKGASHETIGRATEMRSSGIAQLPKIEQRKTYSRTRMIAISNARSGLHVSSYSFGLQIIPEIVGALEDVRRFDAALIVSQDQVDPDVINQRQEDREQVEHRYTSDLCRKLILWAWTRTEDQVVFDSDCVDFILQSATDLCKVFSETVPLIDRGSMRNKLARLTAAYAARVFSTDDGVTLRVKLKHAQEIVNWLTQVYSSDEFGYKRFSDSQRTLSEIKDPDIILNALNKCPFPFDLCDNLATTDQFDAQDIEDWSGCDRSTSTQVISVLVRKRALTRHKRTYRKTPKFIELLNSWIANGQVVGRPDHIPEVEPEF